MKEKDNKINLLFKILNTTSDELEKAGLFLRLGVPSTQIRQENNAFLQTRGIQFENAGLVCVILRTQ